MDITRQANREAQETLHQYGIRQGALLGEKLSEDKLTQLLAFIAELKRTPEGAGEIQRRVKLFGICKRSEGETLGEFYGKLAIGWTETRHRQKHACILRDDDCGRRNFFGEHLAYGS